MAVPSPALSFEKLIVARIHLNQFGKISARAFFLLVIFSFIKLSPDVSGLANIIPLLLETSHDTDDTKSFSYFISYCPFIADGLELIIPMALRFALSLGILEPGFCPGSSTYPIIDGLGVNILLGKEFSVIIGSLAPENSVALLVCFGSKDNIHAIRFYVPNYAINCLGHIICVV